MTCAQVSSGWATPSSDILAPQGRVFTDNMAPKIDTEKLVTVTQAAKLLKITPAAIHKAIKRGRLPYIELGGVFLIQRPDLIKYNKSKSVGGRPKKQR